MSRKREKTKKAIGRLKKGRRIPKIEMQYSIKQIYKYTFHTKVLSVSQLNLHY